MKTENDLTQKETIEKKLAKIEEEDDEDLEEEEEPKEKYWLGVICGIFVPFFIAVLIGVTLFDAGSLERKTFFQTYWGTFGIVYTIGLIVGIIWGVLILSSRKR